MFKHSDISTKVDKKTFIFTLISFLVSFITVILILIFAKGNLLGIMACLLMFVLMLASLITLFGLISDYAYIKDDKLVMNYMFKKSNILLNEIGEIKLNDNIYHVYDKKGNEVGSINALALGINDIIKKFNEKNVPFN